MQKDEAITVRVSKPTSVQRYKINRLTPDERLMALVRASDEKERRMADDATKQKEQTA